MAGRVGSLWGFVHCSVGRGYNRDCNSGIADPLGQRGGRRRLLGKEGKGPPWKALAAPAGTCLLRAGRSVGCRA